MCPLWLFRFVRRWCHPAVWFFMCWYGTERGLDIRTVVDGSHSPFMLQVCGCLYFSVPLEQDQQLRAQVLGSAFSLCFSL